MRNPAAREISRASRFSVAAINNVIADLSSSRRLRQLDDLAGLRRVEAEFSRTARLALALDPAAVAHQLLQHRLGEVRRTAHVPALRLIAETMPQHAVGERS